MAYETSPVPLQDRAGDLLDRVGLVERAFNLESATGNPIEINLNEAPIPVGEAYLVAVESRQTPPVGDDATAALKQDLLASARSLYERDIIRELPNDSLTIPQLQNLIITHAPTYKESELLTYRQALIKDLRRKGILPLDYVDNTEEMLLWMLDDLASSKPDVPETPLQEAERDSARGFESLRAERLKLAQQLQEQGIISANYKLDTFDLTNLDAAIAGGLKDANIQHDSAEEVLVEKENEVVEAEIDSQDPNVIAKAQELLNEINEGVKAFREPERKAEVDEYLRIIREISTEEGGHRDFSERLDIVLSNPVGKAALANFIVTSGLNIIAFVPERFPLGRIIVPVARSLFEAREFSQLLHGGAKIPIDMASKATVLVLLGGTSDQEIANVLFENVNYKVIMDSFNQHATQVFNSAIHLVAEKFGLQHIKPAKSTTINLQEEEEQVQPVTDAVSNSVRDTLRISSDNRRVLFEAGDDASEARRMKIIEEEDNLTRQMAASILGVSLDDVENAGFSDHLTEYLSGIMHKERFLQTEGKQLLRKAYEKLTDLLGKKGETIKMDFEFFLQQCNKSLDRQFIINDKGGFEFVETKELTSSTPDLSTATNEPPSTIPEWPLPSPLPSTEVIPTAPTTETTVAEAPTPKSMVELIDEQTGDFEYLILAGDIAVQFLPIVPSLIVALGQEKPNSLTDVSITYSPSSDNEGTLEVIVPRKNKPTVTATLYLKNNDKTRNAEVSNTTFQGLGRIEGAFASGIFKQVPAKIPQVINAETLKNNITGLKVSKDGIILKGGLKP